MKKKIFYLNENLEYTYEYVFYIQGISSCSHEKIANDERENKFKCTNYFMIFFLLIKNNWINLVVEF